MIQQTKRSYIQLILLLVILCSIAQAHRPIFSEKSESKVIHVEIRDGIRIHTVETEYQNSKQEIHVLLPDRYRKGKHYRVLYVLPVEKGFDQSYGYGLGVLKQMDAHNNHDLIIVQMGFRKGAVVRRPRHESQDSPSQLLERIRRSFRRKAVFDNA